MKKFIATASACMVVGFAVALANADDVSNTTSKDTTTTTTTQQQPGTMGNDTAKSGDSAASGSMNSDPSRSSDMSKSSDSNSNSAMNTSSDRWKTAKTCTDVGGVTYNRGKKGFSHCVDTIKKSERKDQMGGQAGSDINSNSSLGTGSVDNTTSPAAPTTGTDSSKSMMDSSGSSTSSNNQ